MCKCRYKVIIILTFIFSILAVGYWIYDVYPRYEWQTWIENDECRYREYDDGKYQECCVTITLYEEKTERADCIKDKNEKGFFESWRTDVCFIETLSSSTDNVCFEKTKARLYR